MSTKSTIKQRAIYLPDEGEWAKLKTFSKTSGLKLNRVIQVALIDFIKKTTDEKMKLFTK